MTAWRCAQWLVLVAALATQVKRAEAVVIPWAGPASDGASTTVTSPVAPPAFVSGFQSVSGGSFFYEGGSHSITLSVTLDGVSTQLETVTPAGSAFTNHNLSDLFTPVAFGPGTISAITLSENCPGCGGDIFDLSGASFTFDSVGSVAEPASIALLAVGVAGLVAAGRRRRAISLGGSSRLS